MRILTKKQEEKEEADRRSMMERKLEFMGKVTAERVASTGTVDYERIKDDAKNIALVDDVIV